MNIYQYLAKYQITRVEFSNRVGIAESTLYKYINFEREPTLENALKINKASKGEIKFKDMLKKNSDIRGEEDDADLL